MLSRNHWRLRHDRLDPEKDFREITLGVTTHEFPWDNLQALSFALFRTYAVPSVGVLLHDTGELTDRVQKRYDDTGLLLEEILEHGLAEAQGRGREALRRVNRMHAHYDIGNDDMLYVLATFVVTPKRWHERWSYRPLTDNELRACTNYYIDLGRHMGIKDIPADYTGFERFLDDYEATHFAYDPRATRVAESTLELFTTFAPARHAPTWLVKRFSYAIMEEPLLDAFRFPHPARWERRLADLLLRARARVIALLPARSKPKWTRDMGQYTSYPIGYTIEKLGTFPSGCPVHAAQGREAV